MIKKKFILKSIRKNNKKQQSYRNSIGRQDRHTITQIEDCQLGTENESSQGSGSTRGIPTTTNFLFEIRRKMK
jgi:hypothetical protein